MFILLSIHQPHPEHEAALIDSMHRYGNALKGRPGLRSVHTLKDRGSDRLVGLAIFDSEEAFERLAPIAREAVKNDPFEAWEKVDVDGLRLEEV